MTDVHATPQYLVAAIQKLLAEDARTNLLDVQVKVSAEKVFLIGTVESEDRRDAASEVVKGALPPTYILINDLCVTTYSGIQRAEAVDRAAD